MPKLYSQIVSDLKIYDKCRKEIMLKNTLLLSDTIVLKINVFKKHFQIGYGFQINKIF